jgi:type I restriction enzyme S subunit
MKNDDKQSVTPRLRFPEFQQGSAWTIDKLSDVAEFVNERVPVGQIALNNYVSTENILPDFGGLTTASKLPPTGSATRFKAHDILVSNIRPYLKKVWSSDRDGAASNDVMVIRAKSALSKGFFPFVLRNESFIDYVMTGAKGVKMPRGDVGLMKDYPVSYPSPPEQQKIADCLTSLDELIAAQGRKVEALNAHKKGLMQQIFPCEGETLPRLRFPEFRDAPEWKSRKMRDLIEKVSKPVEVETNRTYREIGVRSHGKGIFHKDPVTGAAIGSKRVFHVVPDAFIVNIIFAWEQAVAFTTKYEDGMIASHRFPMYLPKSTGCDVRFLKLAFLTPMGKRLLGIASPGGAGRNRTLGQDEFEKLEVVVPEGDEQTSIADAVLAADGRIATETNKLAALKTHKQGLMQQLFPSPEAV